MFEKNLAENYHAESVCERTRLRLEKNNNKIGLTDVVC
jgi:hypothetical protein